MRKIFAQNLARLRQEAGVCQRVAADSLDVSQALLSHYENAVREPRLDFVVRAAEYYGVSTDELLGCRRGACLQSGGEGAEGPSQKAREADREIRDTLNILLDVLSQDYDPGVFCYASLLISEALYEIIRYLQRLSPNYDPSLFALSDINFDSGAVLSDLGWVRTQFVVALEQYREKRGFLPHCEMELLEQQYGRAYQSLRELVRKVGERVACQNAAERMITSKFFTGGQAGPTLDQLISEQEDSHD